MFIDSLNNSLKGEILMLTSIKNLRFLDFARNDGHGLPTTFYEVLISAFLLIAEVKIENPITRREMGPVLPLTLLV
jgi:hypothetical protein